MVVHKLSSRLALAIVLASVALPAVGQRTGPPTLENLLGPETEDSPTPFDAPPEKPSTDPPRPAPSPPPASKPSERLPVPAESAVDDALELINQAYDESIKAAKANPDSVIRTFRTTADQTADPARKFALLLLAERLAVDAHMTTLAIDTLARRAELFDFDALAARHALLTGIARDQGVRPDGLLYEHIVETAQRAMAADVFDLADAAADLAAATAKAIEKDEKLRAAEARKKREPAPTLVAAKLLSEAAQLQKSVRERRRLASEYRAARERLDALPDDAEAAGVVGRYLCFVRRDWKTGLPFLSRGGDEGLRLLAAREVGLTKETEPAATARLKLANDWWKLSENGQQLAPPESDAIRDHAAGIYRQIAATLDDPIDAALARKRSKTAEPAAETPKSPNPALPTLDSVFQGGKD